MKYLLLENHTMAMLYVHLLLLTQLPVRSRDGLLVFIIRYSYADNRSMITKQLTMSITADSQQSVARQPMRWEVERCVGTCSPRDPVRSGTHAAAAPAIEPRRFTVLTYRPRRSNRLETEQDRKYLKNLSDLRSCNILCLMGSQRIKLNYFIKFRL